MTAAGTGQPAAPVVRDARWSDLADMESCLPGPDHASRIRSADGRTLRFLVVELAGRVVGFGRLVLDHPEGKPRLPYLPRITNLNVHPDFRSQGFGTLLISAMETLARQAGRRQIFLGVSKENDRAMALYRRLGYEPIRQHDWPAEPEVIDYGRRHHAVVNLVKLLA